ncbi:hypothetical protein PSTG_00812 [Puccinia striiformis f. sp. tritici PST-78]|uniref:Myb/SANT-like domain-containing protein n=1 Tax=Puccinia striiformis f. sp. tritici PST-78 TaxID=1165861 RepID=A0A0L0W467_9BASI|nr:hypothetical protein PSTG_00812 [Puccinia striiformis f. sp. tritici PST-78]
MNLATVQPQPSDAMSLASPNAAPPPAPLVATSNAPSPPTAKPKRTRHTKAQMALARQQGPPTPPPGSQTNASQTPTGSTKDEANTNPQFIPTDFQNICSYLEEEQNYSQLYGSGSQTKVGPRVVTKAAAYEMFAVYVNDHSASRLSLNSKQLRQRIDAFKKKFVAAKNWMDNTGAGIEEGRHAHTLPALLEEKCACYDRMDVIFGANPNVTPLAQYESQCGMDLYGLNTNKDPDNDDLPPPESPEVFFCGWSQTQRSNESLLQNITRELPPVPKEFSHRRPGAPASVTSSVWKGLESQFQLDLGASLSSTISNPSLTQVEGNDNNTLAGKNVAPTPTESPTGDSACPGPTPANTASQPANPEPVTNTACFPNQSTGDRSVPAPRRDNSQANKAKSSIAAAFEALTDKKFQYLDKHMAMETDKFSWEKEKYDNGKLRPSNGSLKAGQLPRSTCLNLST